MNHQDKWKRTERQIQRNKKNLTKVKRQFYKLENRVGPLGGSVG